MSNPYITIVNDEVSVLGGTNILTHTICLSQRGFLHCTKQRRKYRLSARVEWIRKGSVAVKQTGVNQHSQGRGGVRNIYVRLTDKTHFLN